ncbi:autotransporter domain-containing protein [Methylobacterium sp. WL9]|uniref:autotransporter domain-containing protein n=1 Tax=Methylobacterium sp. WL9 TaxID=2603898 RepID=UPI0011CC8EB2|nr:autotransporter domain-containing protein [Methylobacterium sp. WL9]TXN19597.1 autotransporter domain-containing protein [Methylobacterium sp. WL9]
MSTSCAAILAATFGLLAVPAAQAANFNVANGVTDSTPKTVSGTDVGTVGVGSTLQSTTGTAITWNNASTTLRITNSGTIQAIAAGTRAINASGTDNLRSILLTNNAGALIISPDDAFRINVNPTAGTITINNAGTIRSQSGQALDFDTAASGAATITINNLASGLIRSDGQDAIRPGQGATVNNAGTIFSTGAAGSSFDGIDFQGKTGTVNNQAGGVISGLRHGITTDTGIVVNNASGATITGRNGSGVGSDGTGTVINFGTITGAYDGSARGDGDGVDIDFAATIINHGTIQGTGAGGFDNGNRANNSEGISIGGGAIQNDGTIRGATYAIVVNNDSNPDNSRSGVAATTIRNDVGGMIVGQNGYAIRLENKTGTTRDNDTIENFGTIIGNGAISDPNAVILRGDNTADPGSVGTLNGVTYTGTGAARFIRGDGAAIQMGEGDDVLANYGTIIGNNGRAISLEGGNDILSIATGSTITGRIDGGVGTDTINLIGTGTGTLANVINVEILNVQGGRWSIIDDQSYASGVTIASGALLQVGNGGTAGSLAANVVDNGTLAFNRTNGVTFAGTISGTGIVQQLGTGVLALTGANTYSGGTTIAAGTLVSAAVGLGSGAVTNNAALVIDQPSDATLGNALNGTGRLTKQGTGTLTYTGNGTLSGPTTVAAGGLVINGSLAASPVNVANGAVGGGTGRIGGLTVQSGATVAPGVGTTAGSLGTLNVAGNVLFAAQSLYQVDATPAGQSDRIAATGTATLQGGTVQVTAQFGLYNPTTSYTILSAAGGLTGRFAGVTSNFAFLTPFLTYGVNDAFLRLARNDLEFGAVAVTRNQGNVAAAAQAQGVGTPLYNGIAVLSASQARQAFDALSGEIHSNAVTSQFATGYLVREAILDRLRFGETPSFGGLGAEGIGQRFAPGTTLPAVYTADLPGRTTAPVPVSTQLVAPNPVAVWGQGFGSFGSIGGDGNAARLDQQTSGFVLGADTRLDQNWRVGVAGGYTFTNLDITGRQSTGTVESGYGALYAGGSFGPVQLRLGGAYAGSSLATNRAVLFPGFSENASARYGGSLGQAFGEAGYRIGSGNGYFEPFVGGAAIRISRDGFTERGGAAALTSRDQDYDIATSTVGVQAQGQIGEFFGSTTPIFVRGLVGYRRAYGDVVPATLFSFGAAGQTFLTAGVPIARDALVAQAGLDWQVTPATTLSIAYTGQVGAERTQIHGVKGGFLYRW